MFLDPIMTDALDALRRVDFDWVRTLDSIWIDTDTDGRSERAARPDIIADLHRKARQPDRQGAGPRAGRSVRRRQDPPVGQLRREAWRTGAWSCPSTYLG